MKTNILLCLNDAFDRTINCFSKIDNPYYYDKKKNQYYLIILTQINFQRSYIFYLIHALQEKTKKHL